MQTDSLKDFVLDQLSGLSDLACRRMFGGYGLYHAGAFFGIIFKGRLYFKTDVASRKSYVRAGMKPFRPNARQTLKNYYEVPADIIEDKSRLAKWAALSVRCQRTAPKKVKPTPLRFTRKPAAVNLSPCQRSLTT